MRSSDAKSKEYGIRYSVFGRNGRTQMKERFFASRDARDAFALKVEGTNSFCEFIAWLDPR